MRFHTELAHSFRGKPAALPGRYTAGVPHPLHDYDWSGFLRRPLFPSPSSEELAGLEQASILITGAGGSIGSALALRIATLKPRQITLLESSESFLFALEGALHKRGVKARLVLGDSADRALLDEISRRYRPTLIFHTAAYKQVPLLESQPLAALGNNITATAAVLDAATRIHARVVLLSTDKAAAPSSVMGASKRICELLAMRHGQIALRLANVLASRDSVAGIFAAQIAAREPITLTSREASRYFITLDEAVNLLLAASIAPHSPALFVPALSKPHAIADLAHTLASFLSSNAGPQIQLTGLRPGDKPHEALCAQDELLANAHCPSLRQIAYTALRADFDRHYEALRTAITMRNLPQAIAALRIIVPGFTPSDVLLGVLNEGEECR